ncbi:MAG TPA: BON domain-containing protein [Candidatus Angelobacter sp.]|nr:BON domain-containing protein [Candidatus Angelobacter sp.]
MKIRLYAISFAFVLSAVALVAQSAQQPQTPPVNPSTPATRIGDGAQTKAGTPAPSSSASSSPTTPAENQTSSNGLAAISDSDLASQIQNALSKEPTLTGDSPHVTITGDTIELAGAVGTNKEKITATRIVQSYAANKKLVNKLTIGKK